MTDARILFVYLRPSTFVRSDLAILRSVFEVREMRPTSPLRPHPLSVAVEVARSDLVFCWFASWHAVLPLTLARIFRKPSIVVVGGYDVASLPSIAYGHQRGGLRKVAAVWAMRAATRVCAFSRAAQREAGRSAGISSDRIAMIHLGVETGSPASDATTRSPLLLTIADVNHSNLRRKGLDRFARASHALPEFSFVVAGAIQDDSADELVRLGGPNLRLAGRVSDDELRDLYYRASAYLQLSMHEGFGLAVAEAMLGGCVPVVTRVGALPEVVGDVGEYVDDASPEAIAAAVRRALGDPARGRASAARIRSLFSLSMRRDRLLGLVRETMRPFVRTRR